MEEPTRAHTQFIAIDGEGDTIWTETKDGVTRSIQWYTLLCASTGEYLAHERDGRRLRLSSSACLAWLADLMSAHPGATFIMYGMSYDVTMILRDLPFALLKTLHEQQRPQHAREAFKGVNYGAFNLRIISRKLFRITRYKSHIAPGKLAKLQLDYGVVKGHKKRVIDVSGTIYDTIGFFQSSFVEAVKKYKLPVEDIDFITEMKSKRASFAGLSTAQIARYSIRECEILVELLRRVEHNLLHPDIDIQLKSWHGAGAISKALLEKHHIASHIGDVPPEVERAGLHAYAGGRIEVVRYGRFAGRSFDYDIGSSYPDNMRRLPSLASGVWIHQGEGDYLLSLRRYPFALLRVKWDLWDPARRMYPFFYRDEDESIFYPARGENWVHACEYLAAMKHLHKYAGGQIRILEAWVYVPRDDTRPFAFIEPLAAKRLEWKRAGEGQALTLKYGLNGLYGQLAQQIGGSIDGDKVTLPKHHSMLYAGNVTAQTRAKLYDLAMENEDAIVMFATDGLFTTKRLAVPLGEGLGEWTEEADITDMLVVQSGIYFSYDGDKWVKKTRGIDPASISPLSVLAAWDRGDEKITTKTHKFITFGMIAMSAAPGTITRNMARLACWEETEREQGITSFGTKRYNRNNDEYTTKRRASNGLLATYPKENATPDKLSKMYDYIYLKPWDELSEEQRRYLLSREEIEEERA